MFNSFDIILETKWELNMAKIKNFIMKFLEK